MSSYQILVVDDEPSVLNTISMVLRYHGHEVETADSGEAAIALLAAGRFQVVVTDYFMPGMKGDRLAAHIKQSQPNLPVIMVTAMPEQVLSGGKLNAHVDILIAKPFPVADLVQAVAKVVAGLADKAKPPVK